MINVLNSTKIKNPIANKKLQEIKDAILGKRYELSVVLVDNKTSKKLNIENRKKDKPANVLSFPLDEKAGEIFLDLETKKESEEFEMSYKKYLTFLFIHGCLHLKGYDHGAEMEKLEDKFIKKFFN
ncbi:rRNA maturation RNase YbeY [Candidatus Parcubacteria bacterium]|nr:rRNA maturation RNase YbeY [Candidatus Parcubacteria bacterium]